MLTLFYIAVIVLNGRIWRQLHSDFSMISAGGGVASVRMLEMNRQITIVLLLQAITPFLTEVLPGALQSLSSVVNITCRAECYVASALYSWMPVLHPTMTLLFIRPYRAALARICCCCPKWAKRRGRGVHRIGGVTWNKADGVVSGSAMDASRSGMPSTLAKAGSAGAC